ncbi:MAG: DUF192 domain-containing protein [Hyphomicrobiaceae bacterium]|nr:DUF192 domain-containing protein [Hyphomicrobiaceae bacterium]
MSRRLVSLARGAVAAMVAGALALVLTQAAWAEAPAAGMARERVVIRTVAGERVFDVEVARTAREKSLGLMYRRVLPAGQGMLFPYDGPDEVTMWMRNTVISLDMIFIRADGRVHRVEAHTEPMSERIIASGGAVTAVLEIAAGEAARLGIAPGDQVEHAHFAAR